VDPEPDHISEKSSGTGLSLEKFFILKKDSRFSASCYPGIRIENPRPYSTCLRLDLPVIELRVHEKSGGTFSKFTTTKARLGSAVDPELFFPDPDTTSDKSRNRIIYSKVIHKQKLVFASLPRSVIFRIRTILASGSISP
jgi:hypothetical protein